MTDFGTPSPVRTELGTILRAGLDEGIYVYETPPEQLQTPAVVIGTTSWQPERMNRLDTVQWSISISIVLPRTAPAYGVASAESLSLEVARMLIESAYRVEGWDDESGSAIGGAEYLTGTLSVIYKQTS